MEPLNRRAMSGGGLFVAGLVLVVLRALTLTVQMPGLPSFWYSNQSMWVAIGIGMAGIGWRMLWGQPVVQSRAWKPAIQGRRFRTAILYVGNECHLCEEAAEILDAHQQWLPTMKTIEIHSDEALVKRYGTCVPVIEFDGKVRFRGQVNETLLRRLIEGTPPESQTSGV